MVDKSYYPKIVFGPLPPKEKLRELIPWEAIGGNPNQPKKDESGGDV